MTGPSVNVHDDLRRAMSNRDARPMIVVGAGVGLAAGSDAWTWTGLVENAIDRAELYGDLEPSKAEELRARLQVRDDGADATIAVATIAAAALKQGGNFGEWLAESVGRLTIRDQRLIVAIRKLTRTFHATLATTNYDDLLTQDGGPPPAVWTNWEHVLRVMRGDVAGVIHLHGVHTSPDSIILGSDDYARLRSDERIQFLEKVAGIAHTIVFVGCGSGLEDPNVGTLLTWLDKWRTPHPHYRICSDDDVRELPAVINVPYERSDAGLLDYLTGLNRSGPIEVCEPPVGVRPLFEVDHTDEVRAVAMASSATRLATAGPDLMLRVWPVRRSPAGGDKPLSAEWSKPAEEAIQCAGFSPDGTILAAAGRTSTQLWSMESRSVVGAAPHVRVRALAFDPTGACLATVAELGDVKVWRVADAIGADSSPGSVDFEHRLLHPDRDVTFGSDGRWIATVDSDGALAIRSLRRRVVLWSIGSGATRVAASARGPRLATGDRDGVARVYSVEALTAQADDAFERLETRTELREGLDIATDDVVRPWCLVDHGAPITALAISDDGRTLVTAGDDASVACWDIRTRAPRQLGRLPLEHEVVAMDLAGNEPLLATTTGDTRAQVWDLDAFS